jgi:glucose-6-phosphate isomerase
VTFIEVLKDERHPSLIVEPDVTSGDFLDGFYLGTRQALAENGRQSMTLTIKEVAPFAVGMLIALFERAVGFYASLVNINAYHQPGVEAGKKAAGNVIAVQRRILELLSKHPQQSFSVSEIAHKIQASDEIETVFKICEHLSLNSARNLTKLPAESPFAAKYSLN